MFIEDYSWAIKLPGEDKKILSSLKDIPYKKIHRSYFSIYKGQNERVKVHWEYLEIFDIDQQRHALDYRGRNALLSARQVMINNKRFLTDADWIK